MRTVLLLAALVLAGCAPSRGPLAGPQPEDRRHRIEAVHQGIEDVTVHYYEGRGGFLHRLGVLTGGEKRTFRMRETLGTVSFLIRKSISGQYWAVEDVTIGPGARIELTIQDYLPLTGVMVQYPK